MQAHGKGGTVENSAGSDKNRMMLASRQTASQANQNGDLGSQRSWNSEDIASEINNEYNISFEKSAIKPVALHHAFSVKSKGNLERDALMREQRLTITRALITTIVNRRQHDGQLAQSPSQVNAINTMNVSASKSQVEESSIEAMNKLVERIKQSNGELAEVGDIGSENANSAITKQLQKDINQF